MPTHFQYEARTTNALEKIAAALEQIAGKASSVAAPVEPKVYYTRQAYYRGDDVADRMTKEKAAPDVERPMPCDCKDCKKPIW
jgi:hypothetical protein